MFQCSMMPGATKNEPASVPAPVVVGAHAEAGRTSESGDGKATVTQRVVELLGLRVRPPVCLQLLGRLPLILLAHPRLELGDGLRGLRLLRLGIAHDRVGSSPPCRLFPVLALRPWD
jgi:hypothetical protein